jgi:hypothetical protein
MCHGPPVEARRQVETHREVKTSRQSKACGKIESSRTTEIRTQTSGIAKSCVFGGGGQSERTSAFVETD